MSGARRCAAWRSLGVTAALIGVTSVIAVSSAQAQPASFQRVPAPDPHHAALGGPQNVLFSIAGSSSSDIWAVGFQGVTADLFEPFAIHWDGTRFREVPAPVLSGGAGGFFNGVSPVPHSQMTWAAGEDDTVGQTGLLELHTASGWRRYPVPVEHGCAAPSCHTVLSSVYAFSKDQAIAAGWTTNPDQTLVLWWNGKRWRRDGQAAQLPLVGTAEKIAASSPRDVWLAGANITEASGGFVMHYNGTHWSGQRLSDFAFGGIARAGHTHTFVAVNDGTLSVGQFDSRLFWMRDGHVLRSRKVHNMIAFSVAAASRSRVWVVGSNKDSKTAVAERVGGAWHRQLVQPKYVFLPAMAHIGDATWAAGGNVTPALAEHTVVLRQLDKP